jgi:ADP-ribose pyrophosphatase YjhB (NUDIX family)
MTELEELLEDPAVEVVDSSAPFGPEEASRVRDGYNRAAAGIIEDPEDRVLFMRRDSGWRLPGTAVDAVVNFEDRLRSALEDYVGIRSAAVEPLRIHRHSATNIEDVPSYHYVLFDVRPDDPPLAAIGQSPVEGVELEWFSSSPEDVINDGVVSRLFATS